MNTWSTVRGRRTLYEDKVVRICAGHELGDAGDGDRDVVLDPGAGALLLTPGFITDTIGFMLLTGPIRRVLARKVINSGLVRTLGAAQGGSAFTSWSSSGRTGGLHSGGNNTYEGEYSEESEVIPASPKPSGDDRDKLA